MYEQPIKLIEQQMQAQLEGTILRAVKAVGVDVDKEELLRALHYDRFQYTKGYEDGKADATPRWIPVTERLPTEEDANEEGLVLVRNIGCPQYEAMDWDQVKMFRSRISHWMPLPEPPTE